MPPKKKQKVPSRGPSTPSADTPVSVKTPVQPTTIKAPLDEATLTADPWTEEQETALFKGILRFKPVGMHKHFRMIALHDFLHSQRVTSASDAHTRIPGIWEKLRSLYNLPILDDRENAFLPSPPDDPAAHSLYHPFNLPEDDFGSMMFERRFAVSPTPVQSDGERQRDSESRMASTADDTEEPKGSRRKPVKTGTRGTRNSVQQEETAASSPAEGVDGDPERRNKEDDDDDEGTENAGDQEMEGQNAASKKGKTGRARANTGGRTTKRKGKGR